MALSAAVKDTQVSVVSVNKLHDAILVEIEKRDTCLARRIVVLLLPNSRQTASWHKSPAEKVRWAVQLFLQQYDFRIDVIVNIANKRITGAIGMV